MKTEDCDLVLYFTAKGVSNMNDGKKKGRQGRKRLSL